MKYRFASCAMLLAAIAALLMAACSGNQGDITANTLPPSQDITVEINTPADGAVAAQDDLVEFGGTAILGRNTQLERESLVWRSDRDGLIGLGAHFNRNGLSPGAHAITLEATGPNGEKAQVRQLLEIRARSNGMTVRISEPPAGKVIQSNELARLQGQAIDSNGQPITADISLYWESTLDQVLGNGGRIEPGGLTPGLHRLTLVARGPDGQTARAAVDLFVELFSTPVQAEILAPTTHTQVRHGEPVTFSGSARDGQGNPIVGPNLLWTSSMDGVVGVGETCIVNNMRLGTHRVTMRAGTAASDITAVSIVLVVR